MIDESQMHLTRTNQPLLKRLLDCLVMHS